MSKFIITAFNQNKVTDQDYVRVMKDDTLYIIQRNKIEHVPKKVLKCFCHMELSYRAVASMMMVKGHSKFGFIGIDYKLPRTKK